MQAQLECTHRFHHVINIHPACGRRWACAWSRWVTKQAPVRHFGYRSRFRNVGNFDNGSWGRTQHDGIHLGRQWLNNNCRNAVIKSEWFRSLILESWSTSLWGQIDYGGFRAYVLLAACYHLSLRQLILSIVDLFLQACSLIWQPWNQCLQR